MTNKIIETIYRAIDDTNKIFPEDTEIIKSPDSELFGGRGNLDSLGLVQLIVNIEKHLLKSFSVSIVLANDKALSMKNSPFRNISTLCEYIGDLLNEK
jgi:acyl carrier protein